MPRIVQANAAAETLDVPEPQILIEYPEDNYTYHHRLLLVHLGQASWIVATPTLDVHQDDFIEAGVVPLNRGSPFPAAGRPFFCFSPLSEAELADLRARARALASVLGVSAPAAIAGTEGALWLVSDPALEEFNSEVPPSLVGSQRDCVIRGAVGLVQLDVDGERTWVVMERVMPSDRIAWLAEKREGAGRDPRLTSLKVDPAGPRALFRDATSQMGRPAAPPTIFKGPSASTAVADAIVASGMEPPAFQHQWVTASGVSAKSALAAEHLHLLTTMWLLATEDRLNLFNLAGAEYMGRRLLQIQRAVRKNPRSPDFAGLEAYLSHALDPSGGVVAPDFDRHVAALQKDEAVILKQNRLAREEKEAEERRNAERHPKGGGRGKKQDPPPQDEKG